MMKVAIFVGTRADLGPLEPVIAAFDEAEHITVDVLGGVAFGEQELTERLRGMGYGGGVYALAEPMQAITPDTMLQQGALLTDGARRRFNAAGYDAIVVLGDRWELLYIVPAALLHGIRIVHVHGGEITEGAIDERVRHAITKLADIHCVASQDAAERIQQMGEPDERIRITGAPGLDRLVAARPLDDDELANILGRRVLRPLGLFTYHPPTAVADAPLRRWVKDSITAALSNFSTLIVTDPGIDEGRDVILDELDEAARNDERIVRVKALGAHYPRVLASVDAVVGNSSSGVIEAATVGVPAIDIGSRQEGRLRAASVLHADDSASSIDAAIRSALSMDPSALGASNPYGNGGAAARIVSATENAMTYSFGKKFRQQEVPDGC